jgi:hypothetical protein
MKKTTENRTMSIVLAELNKSVDKYNLATDAVERVQLAVEHKNLVQEYNELSLLNAYAECMKDENPIVALAKTYYYDTVSVKDNAHNEVGEDGVMKTSVTRSVNDGNKKLDVTKFIEWTEERNKSVAADKTWKTKMLAARNSIEAEWKKFFASKGDTHSMSVGKAKKALQAMFDALVFIPSETGKNAVIANGDIAKWVLGFANSRKDTKVDGNITITGNVLPKSTWNALCLDALHKAVTGKTFDIIFGEPEEEVKEKSEAKAKAKADAKK